MHNLSVNALYLIISYKIKYILVNKVVCVCVIKRYVQFY